MTKHVESYYIKYALSNQEREVARQLANLISSGKIEFEIKSVRDKVEIEQYSHLSAIITRLVQKGLLLRIRRGRYKFADNGIVRCLKELE